MLTDKEKYQYGIGDYGPIRELPPNPKEKKYPVNKKNNLEHEALVAESNRRYSIEDPYGVCKKAQEYEWLAKEQGIDNHEFFVRHFGYLKRNFGL